MSQGPSICYFPTTTIFIDDSRDFLENFSLHLDPDLAFRLFSSPHKALEHINHEMKKPHPLDKLCFSEYFGTDGWPQKQHTIRLNLNAIKDKAYNKQRFEEISVVVVDYDMPEMTGLEFCKQVKNKGVRFLLLTGKADEQTAIKAFNEGVIHQYIKKSDPEVFEKVTKYIREQQETYFKNLSELILKTLAIESPGFLHDANFMPFLKAILEENNFIEYYLAEDNSMLFVTPNGKTSLLTIKSQEDIDMDYDIAADNKAPQQVLEDLKSRKKIAIFSDQMNFSKIKNENEWNNYLFPAKELKGKQPYYYSLVENPQVTIGKEIYSYEKFLDDMDELE